MPPPRHVSCAKALRFSRSVTPGALAWVGGSLVLAALGFVATAAKAQPNKAAAQTQVAMPKPAAKPLWRDLTGRQQRALQPLAPYWDDLTEPHKRKWLVISRDYAKMEPAEQEMVHSRMTEWARLSNQERAQARLNFADVKQVPVDERKAKWEAYQALSDEEKSKLAARAASTRPPGAAPTIRPVPAQKLAPVPAVAADGQHTPRIQLAPPAPAVVATRPQPTAPASVPVAPPVSAEAQVPAPSTTPVAAEPTPAAAPPARVTEQPSSAP